MVYTCIVYIYMCIYIHIYIYIYIHCMCIFLYIYIYIYTYVVCIHVYVYIYKCICFSNTCIYHYKPVGILGSRVSVHTENVTEKAWEKKGAQGRLLQSPVEMPRASGRLRPDLRTPPALSGRKHKAANGEGPEAGQGQNGEGHKAGQGQSRGRGALLVLMLLPKAGGTTGKGHTAHRTVHEKAVVAVQSRAITHKTAGAATTRTEKDQAATRAKRHTNEKKHLRSQGSRRSSRRSAGATRAEAPNGNQMQQSHHKRRTPEGHRRHQRHRRNQAAR